MERRNILTSLQFIQFVRDLGFEITSDKDLNDPTPEFLQELYIECLLRCTSLTRQSLKNVPFEVVKNFNIENTEKGVQFVSLYAHLKELLNNLGIHDFNLNDILFPDSKRTRKIFSELANFISHKDEETKFFEKIIDENVEIENKLKKIKEQHAAKTKEYDDLKEKKALEKADFDLKEIETNSLGNQFEQLLIDNQYLNEQIDDLNNVLSENEKELKKKEEEIWQAKQEIKNLNNEIVASPEKLIKKKAEILEEIAKEKSMLSNKENEILISDFILKCYYSIGNKILKKQNKFKEINSLLETEANFKQELTEKKMVLYNLKSKNDNLKVEAKELIWNLKNVEEKVKKLDGDIKRNNELFEENIQMLKEEAKRQENLQTELGEALKKSVQLKQEALEDQKVVQTQYDMFCKREEKFYSYLKSILDSYSAKTFQYFEKI